MSVPSPSTGSTAPKSQPKPENEQFSSPALPSFSGDRLNLGLHTCGEFALREQARVDQARGAEIQKGRQTPDVHGILKSKVFGDSVHHVEHPVQDLLKRGVYGKKGDGRVSASQENKE